MNPKNTNKLFEDFPELYVGKDKPLTENLMAFGFECMDGWFDLIYELSGKIVELDPKCEAIQVKEKFGLLRFYVGPTTIEILDLREDYEDMSSGICESCGSTEGVSQTKRGWITTLCKKCMEEKGIDPSLIEENE